MRSTGILVLAGCAALLNGQSRIFTDSDFARMRSAIDSQPWAAKVKADLVAAADAWPASHIARYGLSQMELPPDGGQWWHWYVCPTSGVRLRFEAPNSHICPTDSRRVTGWPYDQVIYSQRHDELAGAARDLALAFRLTGKREYAERSAWILKAYADRYTNYALHDKDNRNTRTGGRAHAQTLDESIWLIPLGYAYDLLAASDVLDASGRQHIEHDLLRAAVDTIRRNDAGISNWQAWHNAGMGAVAFALGDEELIKSVIDGPSGFRFHMNRSVTPDGFWYEGSFTYHYYALDSLIQLAEMASRSRHDLWAETKFRKMFESPLLFAFADGTLAAFNDATTVNFRNYSRMYESAFAHWGDARFAAVAASRSRGRDALLFGAPSLDGGEPAQRFRNRAAHGARRQVLGSDSEDARGHPAALESTIFDDSGYAVLRSTADHALNLKYGPHGGGHGHNDKLNFVSYGFGGILAVDPGTQAYSAPTHATWDKSTIAHNTVVIDGQNQGESTGRLMLSKFADGVSIARAQAGEAAYRGVILERTVVHTAEYSLDVFDVRAAAAPGGEPRTIDWIYHNDGLVQTGLTLAPITLSRQNGYQHLTNNRAAATDESWKLTFDGTKVPSGIYGGTYASTANVKGAFEFSGAQALTGRASGRLSYQFNGAGYLLFTTATVNPALQPANELPASVKIAVYGDGSGHRLLLRINDASDERFVTPLATVDWIGWKEFEIRDPAKWPQHYLGNADGNVDLPVRSVGIELQQDAQGPKQGEMFVDDIAFVYPGDDPDLLVAGFEVATRSTRVWMLGGAGTTVVTGNGLGPDLTKPVPYVMARRRASETRFVTLLEPYGSVEPAIRDFRRIDDNTLKVVGDGWEDTIEARNDDVFYTRKGLPVVAAASVHGLPKKKSRAPANGIE